MTSMEMESQVDDDLESNDPCPDEPFTDVGMAQRLITHASGDLAYVPQYASRNPWMVWVDGKWSRQHQHVPYQWAHMIAREVGSSKYENKSRVDGMLNAASKYVTVNADRFDTDAYALNCPNGTYDLGRCSFGPARRVQYQTKSTRASYRQDATAPRFRAFMEQVQPDPDMRGYVQRLLGYALLGEVREHVLVIFTGSGANGKSTMLDAVKYALGDYADSINGQLLTGIGRMRVPVEERNLQGLRMAVVNELDGGQALDEAKIKRLTGGDGIKARNIGQDEVSFAPSHTLFVATNGRPDITGTDDGIWRRVKLVEWPASIPADEQDKSLSTALRAEADGILAWLIEGYQEWAVRGLDEPQAVSDRVETWREDSDVIGTFLRDRTTATPGATIGSKVLYDRYKEWCTDHGETAQSQKRLSMNLVARGYVKERKSAGIVFYDLA